MKCILIYIYFHVIILIEAHNQLHRRHNSTKSIIGNTLYTLHIEMDSYQILDFLIDNSYGQSNYIKDHFNIPRPQIKISSIQRMLENAELPQLDSALNDLSIDYEAFKTVYLSYHPTYRLMTLLGISVGKTVDNFLGYLDNNSETLFNILKLVNIDPTQFQEAVQTKTEEEFFDLLAEGNYQLPNVEQALQLANVNVTMTNIVRTLNLTADFITQFVLNLDGSFTGVMRRLQVTPENLKLSLRNFDMIVSSKEPEAMVPMPSLLEGLQELKTVATQISEYKAVTHKDADIIKTVRGLAPTVKLIGTNLFDARRLVLIPNTLNPTMANYATLWSEESMGSDITPLALTDEIQKRKDFEECGYWYVDNKFARKVKVVPTLYQKHFLVKKEEVDVMLIDGTPLVCYGKLYAVSIDDNFGKAETEFFSKYPIMKREEESTGNGGFLGGIFNSIKRMFKGIWDLILSPFEYLKRIFNWFKW